jgi:SAM-dependent methyltransferase
VDGFTAFAPDMEACAPSYPLGAHEELHQLEDGHFWFEGRNRLILWAIRRYFPDAARLLEIGCGTGFVLRGIRDALPSAEVSGSEIFTSGLSYASHRAGGAALFQMDARRIPFRNHFDLIGAFDVIEHIEDDEAVLSEMLRALRPGGGVLLTVPQHRWLWSPVDVFAGHARRYRRKELLAKLDAAGFEIITATSFVTGLLPMMFLSRFLKRGQATAGPELRVGRLQNMIGSAFGSLELLSLRAGVRLPAGGSLLVAARRKA